MPRMGAPAIADANDRPPARRGLLRWIRGPNLRGKVTLLLLALSLAPLLVAGVVNVNRAVEQGQGSVRTRHAQAVLMTAEAVGATLDRARDELGTIARRFPTEQFNAAAIAERMAAGQTPVPSVPTAWDDLGDLARLNEQYSAAFLALPDGRLVWSTPHHNLQPAPTLAGVPGFRADGDRAALLGVLPPLTGTTRPRILRVQPLYQAPRDRVIGWSGLVIEPAVITDLLVRARGPRAPNQPVLFIVDGADRVVAHTDPAQVGQPAPAYLVGLESAGQSTGEVSVGDTRYVVARAPVRNSRWHVVLAVPADAAYREVSVLIWILTAVFLLTLVFVFLFADYLASKLLAPIRALEEGARMLGGGALDYRIGMASHSGDELGRLAATFNAMGDSLLENRDELRAYGRSLETANAELDALVYGITHDLKKSLRSIDAFATFLEEDHGQVLDADGLSLVRGIEGKVERINELADDLVALVQQERERGEASQFPLAELVDEVRERVVLKHPGTIVVTGQLPELNADRAQIGLLLEQLFENGLKFNRAEAPQVTVRHTDAGLDWHIEVEDNGIGIDARYHDHIFELFSRLNQPDEFIGSGTGLSLARRIVEEHRGRLTVEARPGGGTRFVVALPKQPMLMTRPGLRLDDVR